jgi:hypothetical protein
MAGKYAIKSIILLDFIGIIRIASPAPFRHIPGGPAKPRALSDLRESEHVSAKREYAPNCSSKNARFSGSEWFFRAGQGQEETVAPQRSTRRICCRINCSNDHNMSRRQHVKTPLVSSWIWASPCAGISSSCAWSMRENWVVPATLDSRAFLCARLPEQVLTHTLLTLLKTSKPGSAAPASARLHW